MTQEDRYEQEIEEIVSIFEDHYYPYMTRDDNPDYNDNILNNTILSDFVNMVIQDYGHELSEEELCKILIVAKLGYQNEKKI